MCKQHRSGFHSLLRPSSFYDADCSAAASHSSLLDLNVALACSVSLPPSTAH